jgi:hypothetical protein
MFLKTGSFSTNQWRHTHYVHSRARNLDPTVAGGLADLALQQILGVLPQQRARFGGGNSDRVDSRQSSLMDSQWAAMFASDVMEKGSRGP